MGLQLHWVDTDQGIGYALALLAAAVTVELHLFPGTFHGSALIQHTAISQRKQTEMLVVPAGALIGEAAASHHAKVADVGNVHVGSPRHRYSRPRRHSDVRPGG